MEPGPQLARVAAVRAAALGQPQRAGLLRRKRLAPVTNPEEHERVVQNIARSTIPLEHLQGLRGIRVAPVMHPMFKNIETLTPAQYHTKKRTVTVRPGFSDMPQVIHEIGHHAGVLQGRQFDHSPSSVGQEEAHAENYADSHFRSPSGGRVSMGTSGEDWSYFHEPEHKEQFRQGFERVRQRSAWGSVV